MYTTLVAEGHRFQGFPLVNHGLDRAIPGHDLTPPHIIDPELPPRHNGAHLRNVVQQEGHQEEDVPPEAPHSAVAFQCAESAEFLDT